MRPLLAALLVCAGAAAAQERPLLYDNPAPLVTSARLVGLGGAAVGLAEGAESMPFNYAAVAQRSPRRSKGFDFDLTFDVLLSPAPDFRDTDNDPNASTQIIAPVEAQIGGLIQFKRFGLGAYTRLSRKGICVQLTGTTCTSVLEAQAAQGAIVFGFNVWRDQLVFGIGLFLASAEFDVGPTALKYLGANVGGSALWRPAFLPFRIGISGVTQTNGTSGDMTATISGRPAFSGIVAPARISLGASARFGKGSWRYNRVSLSALKELPEDFNVADVPHDLDPDDPRPPGRFLVSVQLDVILPVSGATTLNPFLKDTMPLPAAGASLSLVPRAGTEIEAIDHILRLRAGGYLEPAVLAGTSVRPHGTFGFEVFLIHVLFDWSVAAAGDIANRYFSMSLGLGWWT
jgi:hypothetical protein